MLERLRSKEETLQSGVKFNESEKTDLNTTNEEKTETDKKSWQNMLSWEAVMLTNNTRQKKEIIQLFETRSNKVDITKTTVRKKNSQMSLTHFSPVSHFYTP